MRHLHGRDKDCLPFAVCDCGKLYHVTCGFRIGVCVSCSAQMMETQEKERLTLREKITLLEERLLTGHISELTYLQLKAKYEDALRREAPPSEKKIVPEFECPECGETLSTDAAACPRCGARFE